MGPVKHPIKLPGLVKIPDLVKNPGLVVNTWFWC